jgi:hypothetical protein
MIAGMLDLDFDVFRTTPFKHAALRLSNGDVLQVLSREDREFPLEIRFKGLSAELCRQRSSPSYSPSQRQIIANFRETARPILRQVDFELLDIHRSIGLRNDDDDDGRDQRLRVDHEGRVVAPRRPNSLSLSNRVRDFVSAAQINYRKFFAADELELLPRIIDRFEGDTEPATREELRRRIENLQMRSSEIRRFGLQSDDDDLKSLAHLIDGEQANKPNARILVGAYVEMQESRQKARELISKRLLEFEAIMDDFLSNKRVRIDAVGGLVISAADGPLKETQLSSGEYHFVYMMVAALLCQRSGSIIAIDEPELSLHVTWQRKIVAALSKCAAGAAPLFIFATHSAAIAAEHPSSIYRLSSIE